MTPPSDTVCRIDFGPSSRPGQELSHSHREQLEALRTRIAALESVVVAFSGGADSALLAWVAHEQLGPLARACTAVSPSLAQVELDSCRGLADEWGIELSIVETAEMERAAYRRNGPDRCYHCKAELMEVVAPIAAATSATVLLGVNLDDLDDHRPGQAAALEAGAVFPFVEVGMTKQDVRAISRWIGLSTWNKPAAACLASRIPHGVEVSVELLSQVERAEAVLRDLGFTQCRVRHHGETARIEVDANQLTDLLVHREVIAETLHRLGYRFVTLDLDGFRSGSLNPT